MAKPFALADFAYAHRGLWTEDGLPENSLAACLAAADAGFGIEFDVRPSSDGEPIVFHDETLDRMTARSGRIEQMTSVELQSIPLKAGSHQIISLATLLSAWPATTPLLCELKIDGTTDPVSFAERVGDMLLDHDGPAAAMSFSVTAVQALPDALMKGQLIAPSSLADGAWFNQTLNALKDTRPDYVAPNVEDAEAVSTHPLSARYPSVIWTVRDEATLHAMKNIADAQIFENLNPGMVKSICGSTL
ncbi:MAG: glycerophosphodiester phosphodiesterase family protein [Henriciella sp.]|nr:glycerophosphodiester phosphodiesterase family protein [Henriciella sp.]